MALSPGPKLVLILLLSCGLLNSSPLDLCPEFCTCQPFFHLNCSSAGLSLAPLKINPSITELDFSNNQLGSLTFQSKYYNLQKVWLGNNSMSQLSLCVDMDLKGQSKSRLRRRWGCLLWAPTLQLLSMERNQLEKLPEGLEQQKSLQILDLSFNKISTLEHRDFSHLKQLEELHLQHNLISSLYPQIFEKLDRLKVLDLSFNLLTTLHPVTYISLHHIGADVGLSGNSWICDCGMHFLQRQVAYDNNKGLKMWSIECASPLALSGMNLQELHKEDLRCQDSDIHQDVTVYRGSEILLTCSEPDAAWWMPNGETKRNQEQGSLSITDVTEQDEGLYVCLSKSHQILSLYNLQLHEKNRQIRSVSDNNVSSILDKMVQTKSTVPQSRFAMAVSLSVIITFIIAFILGALLQPYICICWQKIKTKKQKPQTNSVSNVQQEQYVNDAYLHSEDVDDFEPYRERRVTFTEYTEEEGNMQYYDAVGRDAQEGNGAVIGPGQAKSDSSDDSSSEDGKHNHRNVNNLGKKIQFEIIPNSIERNSISSQSSLGDKRLKENCSTPNANQATEEQFQRTTIDVPQMSIEKSKEIPGFISEPFADWSPHGNDISNLDPDLDNGEQFEYSDSVRSGSPTSPNSSFKQPNLNAPNVNKKISFESSSSSSDISDSEPTHYTVNPDSEEYIFETRVSTKSSSSSIDSETDSHHAVEAVVDLEHIPTIKRRLMFKTVFVDSYNIDMAMKNELQQEQLLPTIKKRKAPLPPPRKYSSSSSDSEDEIGIIKQEKTQLGTKHDLKEQELAWPIVNLEHVGKVERRLDFKAQYAASESFPSSNSQDERIYEEIQEQIRIYTNQESTMATTEHMSGTSSSSESDDDDNIHKVTSPNKQPIMKLEEESQWAVIDLTKIPQIKQRLDIKEKVKEKETHVHEKIPSTIIKVPQVEFGTSSSSESEDERETKEVQENYYENIQLVTSQKKQPIVMLEQESQWPVINLVKIPKVKRRLDLKTVKPIVDTASSSDSEEEQVYVNVQGKVPSGVANVLKPESGTSSSSESEDEQEIKVNQDILQQTTSSIKPPAAAKPDLESQWPVVDLVRIPKVKRRLDITKRLNVVPSGMPSEIAGVAKSDSGTSSSSESEDEQEIKVKQHQEKIPVVTSPNMQPTDTHWPAIDLVKIPKVKRRLDIKERESIKVIQVTERVPSAILNVPESETSSSSESEDEQQVKANQVGLQNATYPMTPPTAVKPNPEPRWPVVNLVKVHKVKRRLDIKTISAVGLSSSKNEEKVPSTPVNVQKPQSDTSSSSESEDEQEFEKVTKENLQQIAPPIRQQTEQHESKWPKINLVKIPKVKRRLDIKQRVTVKMTTRPERVPSTSSKVQYSGTSSSSESEEEQEINVNHYENIQMVTSPTKQLEPVSQWPVINLKIAKLKRRLDIKTTTPDYTYKLSSRPINVKPESGTSSSSESENEHKIKEIKQENMLVTSQYKQPIESQWPVINLVKIPKVKHRLDIKQRATVKMTTRPERVPSTSSKVQYSGTSSSSESEEEQEIKVNHYENIQLVTSPTKQLEPESQWPVINLKITKLKRRLDIKTTTPDYTYKLSSRPINVKPESGTSSSSESENEHKIKEIKQENMLVTSQYKQLIESQWPVINLVKIPKVKRRLDIKQRATVKMTTRPERVPSTSSKVQYSGTSSSSESEEEQEIKVNHYENIQLVTSPTKQLEPESQWPVINLKIAKLKRRLDIKTTTPDYTYKLSSRPINVKPESGTSSSSESENEHKIKEIKQGNMLVTSQYKQPIESQWPVLNLVKIPKVKRRLDIKERVTVIAAQVQERVPSASIMIPKQDSVTSSSSESDDEQKIKEIVPPIMPPTVGSQWPLIDLVRVPKLKQRLDIKERVNVKVPSRVPSTSVNVQQLESDTSSSSESEDEEQIKVKVNQENVQQIVTTESKWPVINLVKVPKVKRRLDIKTPIPETDSSSSDSEDEDMTLVQDRFPSTNITIQRPTLGTSFSSESDDDTIQKVGVTTLGSKAEPQTQWPVVDLGDITQIKRRLDFKIASQSSPLPVPASGGSSHIIDHLSSSSSDEDEKAVKSSQITAGQTTRLPNQTSLGIPHISRRLDIKGPSMKPGLQDSDSSSSSDDEKNKPKLSSGSLKSQENKDFIKVTPILSIPRSPTKTTPSIELEKYTVGTDDLRNKATSTSTSPVVTPELQSKWASMNLGLSRFRKRLDITRTSDTPPLPSSPPPSSPKLGKLTGISMVKVTEQVSIAPTRVQNVDSSSSSESEDDSKLDSKSPMVEVDTLSPQVNIISVPQVKRSLIITTNQKKHSSSSSSDEDTLDMRVPDLNLGIPRIKRRLNIKAPTPPPSSSSSDDEKLYAHKFSDVTDQRSIEYKRTIMKSNSNDFSTTNREIYKEPLYVESNPHTPKKLSLDNIKRRLMPSKQNELPPNLRWTSVGSHLSEHPVPIPKRQESFTSPPPMFSASPVSKDNTSDSSSSEDEQKEVKTTLTVTKKTYNPRSVTFNTSPTILNAATFEDRTERRGLSAIKALSSERKYWDSESNFTESVPVSVDYNSEQHTHVYRRTVDVKTKISQPLTYSTVSPTSDERRRADMLYRIPSYKRHTIKSTELPQGPPPPIPSTPLPEDSTDFTWRSPQTSPSRGSLSYVQKKTTEEESVDDPFYDNPNISAV